MKNFVRIELKFTKYVIKKIEFLSELNSKEKEIDLIGFHGNTIIHNPKKNISVQLGNPKDIAKKINLPVVANFEKRY